jgi:hypothetical protein
MVLFSSFKLYYSKVISNLSWQERLVHRGCPKDVDGDDNYFKMVHLCEFLLLDYFFPL